MNSEPAVTSGASRSPNPGTLENFSLGFSSSLSPRPRVGVRGIGCLLLLLLVSLSGCVTKAKAKAQAQEAFLAGQQQALRIQQQQQPQPPQAKAVTIVGQVRNPLLPWRPDLTLAQAIIEASFSGPSDPIEIFVVRNGQAVKADINKLLAGQDMQLLPGDIVQIK